MQNEQPTIQPTKVRNAWYAALYAHNLGIERLHRVQILGQAIVLWRTPASRIVGLEDRCIHRLAPLSMGRCEGEYLRCMYHGFLYNIEGKVVDIPGQETVPVKARVFSFPVVEKNNWIWVWMGEPLKADPALIPTLEYPDAIDFVYGAGQMDYEADADLICENLLDLSHASFLHLDSFRFSKAWVLAKPKVTELPRGLRIDWWIKDEPVLGSLSDSLPHVDTFFRYEFFVPGAILMLTWVFPVGTADAVGTADPDLSIQPVSLSYQAITPLGVKQSRYFYVMGLPRTSGENIVDLSLFEKAFTEDRLMIEGQQRNIEAAPGRRFMPAKTDKAVLIYNQLKDQLLCQESA